MLTPILLDARNPGPMTGRGNNTYLIVGSDRRAVLIDAGVGHPDHLSAVASELDRQSARLSQVLVTHGHADHAGGAAVLKAAYPDIRLYKFPWPEVDDVDWEPIADGDEFFVGHESLLAVHTPGHSPDHMVFWDRNARLAYTGDLVVSGGSVMIHSTRGGKLAEYMSSLERVRRLEAVRLLPAHGTEVTEPEVILQQYLTHRRMRERQVFEALAAGRRTVQAIADSIYDGLNPALVPAAQENVRAHLDKLKDDGRAVEDNGIWTTSSTSSTSTGTDTSTN